MYDVKLNKPYIKDFILYYSIFITFSKGQNWRDRKKISSCQELRVGKRDDYDGQQGIFSDLQLDCNDGYTTVHVCQHSQNFTQKKSEFHHIKKIKN